MPRHLRAAGFHGHAEGFGRKGTYDKERNLTYSDKGTYGTSGFMTDAEMQEVLELVGDIAKSRGVILGKLYGKAVCLRKRHE